jgi:hypothetical protein
MKTVEKTFDAVALQRKIREELDTNSDKKSFQERKTVIQAASERFRNRIKAIQAKEILK